MSIHEHKINPKTLTKIRQWAYCETPEDLAGKIVYGVRGKKSKNQTRTSRKEKTLQKKHKDWTALIKSFEDGTAKPTLSQLKKIASVCHRPHSFFLLPPEKVELPERPTDFHKDRATSIPETGECHSFILEAITKQQWARPFIRQTNPKYRPSFLDFEKKHTHTHDDFLEETKRLVKKIEKDLKLDLSSWRRKGKGTKRDQSEQLDELKSAIEQRNILLFTTNNRRHRFSMNALRGFAIYDRFAPLIALNDGDPNHKTYAERVFALLHELAHLYVFKEVGVASFGYSEEGEWREDMQKRERFCNMVAEEFILPASDFEAIWQPPDFYASDINAIAKYLKTLAEKSHVNNSSKWVVLYRARNLGKLNQNGKFSANGQPDYHAHKIFHGVRAMFFEETKRRVAAEKAKRMLYEAKRKNQVQDDEKKVKKKYDSAKALMDTNGAVLCKVAMDAYQSNQVDKHALKEVLGVHKPSDIRTLQKKLTRQ